MIVDAGDALLPQSLVSSSGRHGRAVGRALIKSVRVQMVTNALSSLIRNKGQGREKIPSLRAVADAIDVEKPSDSADVSSFLKAHKTEIRKFVFMHPEVRQSFVDAQEAFDAPYKLSVQSVGELFHELTGLPARSLSEIAQTDLKAASFNNAPGIHSLAGFKLEFVQPFETAAPDAVPNAASELPGWLALSIGIPPINSTKEKLQGPWPVDCAHLVGAP